MKLRKFIATTIREYLNEQQILNESLENNLIKKYDKVIFSPNFYKAEDNLVKYLTKSYLEKIDKFIKFYKKYKPEGIRVINGIDYYKESKAVFDKVVSGEIYIDEVFRSPDNPLRDIVMMLHIDEPALKRKLGENTSIDIDNKLNKINNRRKKRSLKFVYGKEQMIDDTKEVVNVVGGVIKWKNPKVTWTMDYFINSNGKSIKWEDMSEKTLETFISEMNSIFIYGYGSNQEIIESD